MTNKDNLNQISDNLIKIYIKDLLRKNNVSSESGSLKQVSPEEKKALKEIVDNLSNQVDTFLENSSNKNTESKSTESENTESDIKSYEGTLREKFKKIKEQKSKNQS